MNRGKTNQIVFGAMMVALYAVIILLDTYTGGMMNLFIYYILPVPFVVYGLKYSIEMMLAVGFASICVGFMLGLPETIFYTFCAICVAIVLVLGLKKQMKAGHLFLLIALVTVLSEVLSVTLLAAIFGYDVMAELAEVEKLLGMTFFNPQIYLPLICLLMGIIEAYIMTNVTDIVLFKLNLQRIPKFSLMMMKLPKWYTLLCILSIVISNFYMNNIIAFIICVAYFSLCVQGVSLGLFTVSAKKWPILLGFVPMICCFIPIINVIIASLGAFDSLNSDLRLKIVYNRAK